MTREQRTNANVLRIISKNMTEEATVEYNDKQYRTFIWDGDNGTKMRIIIGENDWLVCPAEWNIERCFQ